MMGFSVTKLLEYRHQPLKWRSIIIYQSQPLLRPPNCKLPLVLYGSPPFTGSRIPPSAKFFHLIFVRKIYIKKNFKSYKKNSEAVIRNNSQFKVDYIFNLSM